jgi:hypothetical protein
MCAMSCMETKGSSFSIDFQKLLTLQCVYENVGASCKKCADRGLPCGEKLWGQRHKSRESSGNLSDGLVESPERLSMTGDETTIVVSRQPGTPDDFSFDREDVARMKFFVDVLLPSFIEEINRPGSSRSIQKMFERFGGGMISSKVVRSAIVLYSFGVKQVEEPDSSTTNVYLQRYNKHAAETSNGPAELMYASFFACQHGFISRRPFTEVAPLVELFVLGFETLLQTSKVAVEELFLILCMCKELVCCMTGKFGVARYETDDDEEEGDWPQTTQTLYQFAERIQPFFELEMVGNEPDWMKHAYRYMRTQILMYRLQISFDYLLVLQKCGMSSQTSPVADSIIRIVEELADMVSQDQEIRSLVDHRHLFDRLNEISAALPRPEDSGKSKVDHEWFKWQPALLAHYKLQWGKFWENARDDLLDRDSPASTPKPCRESSPEPCKEVVEAGMAISRNLVWTNNKASLFRMKSLSSLSSLIVACIVLTEDDSFEGNLSVFFC